MLGVKPPSTQPSPVKKNPLQTIGIVAASVIFILFVGFVFINDNSGSKGEEEFAALVISNPQIQEHNGMYTATVDVTNPNNVPFEGNITVTLDDQLGGTYTIPVSALQGKTTIKQQILLKVNSPPVGEIKPTEANVEFVVRRNGAVLQEEKSRMTVIRRLD